MTKATFIKAVCLALLIGTVATAQPPGERPGFMRRGLFGDWQIQIQFGERQMPSILAFSRDEERNLTAQMISFWGLTDLQDVKFEEGKLSFVQVVQFGDNEFRSDFSGTVEEGKLTGTMSSDRGDSEVTGQRAPRTSRAVGDWQMKYRVGERDVTGTLAIRANKEGVLSAQWQSERGESKIADLQFERRTLSFKRTSTFGDRTFESTFEGTLGRDGLTGVFKSERGEIQVEGTLANAPAIGDWIFSIEGERGTRKQRLRVNADMTGLYGTLPIEKVSIKDGQVSFKVVSRFGDREFETSFAGKLAEQKLTGELTTPRGTNKVTAAKVVRRFPGRRPTQ